MRKNLKTALFCAVTIVTLFGFRSGALADRPSVWIQSDVTHPQVGDVVVLTARTSGVAAQDLMYQWVEARSDGSESRDLPGETGRQFRFVFEERHRHSVWRVRLIEAEQAAQNDGGSPAQQPEAQMLVPPMVPPAEAAEEHVMLPPMAPPAEAVSDVPAAVEPDRAEAHRSGESEHPTAAVDDQQAPPADDREPPGVDLIDILDMDTPMSAGGHCAAQKTVPDIAEPRVGDRVTLSPAMPADGARIAQYQWYQDRGDGAGYRPIPGQRLPTYTYTFDGTQSNFHWLVLVTYT